MWRDPAIDPRTLLTRELLQRSYKSELRYDFICQDIFNDLKRLLFANKESLTYDEVDILLLVFDLDVLCNISDFLFVQAYSMNGNIMKF